ncbi:putative ankyrin repeat protein RF_0580 [Wyeomyia smithii]|uniref:putative ankyrin repeat protein RF_0580 n=1 Tax=Wyeomyia smithii TaxID=174621 RepID=UPI0024680762|nr:putative ankyrin repeat protein RF_0580 [Wyeomyia smithii]
MACTTQEKLIHSDENFKVYLFKQTTSVIGFRWDFSDESPLEPRFDLFKVEKCYSCKRNQWEVVYWGTAWSVTVRNLEQNLCYSFRINVLKQDRDDDSFIYLRRSGIFKSFTLPDVPSTTAVFRAVKKSQPGLIRKQLSIKPELINVPVNGETLLYQAVRTGNVEVVDLLLELGADVNLGVPMNGETPLHLAVYNKNIKMVRHLLEHGADISLTNCAGLSAGHYAVDSNDLPTLKFVLSHGCSAEARDRCSWTLIFRAIFMHCNPDIIKHLVEKKCRLKIRDENHLTPLDYARLTNQEEVIKLLKRRLKI